MKNRVLILMSTYNAEKYLAEQIKSLREQRNVCVSILCRDDGSTDDTIRILKSLGIDYYTGSNLGPARSFMDLIEKCSETYEYYAFCDQDDYWYPDKLKTAIEYIDNEKEGPVLYYSAVNVTDEKLKVMYKSFKTTPNALSEIALSCGIMQGCTQVFNRQLLLQLKRHKPNSIAMHDFYITLVCKFLGGKFVMDSTPQISYRQHSTNTLGITAKKRASFYQQYSHTIKEAEFYKDSSTLSDEDEKFVDAINNYLADGSSRIDLMNVAIKTTFSLKWKLTLVKNLLLKRF